MQARSFFPVSFYVQRTTSNILIITGKDYLDPEKSIFSLNKKTIMYFTQRVASLPRVKRSCHQFKRNVVYKNGRESAVSRSLDGSTYPGKKLVPFSLKFFVSC